MASISVRTFTKSAAVAGALGIAFALGAPAAHAQDEGLDFGSLLGILDMENVAGSITGSLTGEGGADTGSAGSLAGFLNEGSLEIGVGTAQGSSGSAGSVGEAAGTLNPGGFGEIVGGSIETMSADEEGATGSLGEIPAASIENFFGTLDQITPDEGDEPLP